MVVLLYVLAGLACAYSVLVMGVAKSSIHEIQAGVALLMASVLFGAAAVCSAVNKLRRAVMDRAPVAAQQVDAS